MAFEASNAAKAYERNIFSKNHDYIKVFPCHGEHVHVRTYIWGLNARVAENYEQTHIRRTSTVYDNNNINYVLLKYIRIRNAFCIRKHVMESICNSASGVRTKNGHLYGGK